MLVAEWDMTTALEVEREEGREEERKKILELLNSCSETSVSEQLP